MGAVLGLVLGVAVVGGIIWLVHRAHQKRLEAMRAACTAMGFTYTERADPDELAAAIGELPLFSRGRGRKAWSVMRGSLAGRPAMLMDYEFTTGSGRNQTTHRQTVALFPDAGGGLPDFELAPENIFHKIGAVFGYQDIDFETSEEFSKRYLLRGREEDRVRAALSADALAFFAQNPGWTVQLRGGRVAAYRAGRRCRPEEAPSFLAEALRIASLFAR
jgi:hypothetical protein